VRTSVGTIHGRHCRHGVVRTELGNEGQTSDDRALLIRRFWVRAPGGPLFQLVRACLRSVVKIISPVYPPFWGRTGYPEVLPAPSLWPGRRPSSQGGCPASSTPASARAGPRSASSAHPHRPTPVPFVLRNVCDVTHRQSSPETRELGRCTRATWTRRTASATADEAPSARPGSPERRRSGPSPPSARAHRAGRPASPAGPSRRRRGFQPADIPLAPFALLSQSSDRPTRSANTACDNPRRRR